MAEPSRRFPLPWTVVEKASCFVVEDASGQALGWFYFRDEPLVAREAACCSRTRPGAWR
jgi:hypothetical protein